MRHSVHKLIRRSVLVLATFALVFISTTFSHAQESDDAEAPVSHARIVRISYVTGAVSLDSGNGFESVTLNIPVTESNRLQTRSDGWVEVQMEDGSMIRLAPDTLISFTTLARSASGGTVTAIDLDQGEAEFKILKSSGNNFEVTVKNKTVVLGRAGFFRVTSTSDDPMEVAVWKGSLAVHDGESGQDVTVKKNETFVLDPNDTARYALDPGTEADQLDAWSKQRDGAGTYAANQSSPNQYGTSDLGNYGQFTDDPEYGSLWQPNDAGLDWNPYGNGYYCNTGLGYTWISAYPWGWAPYRFGRWIFINGRGWYWAPGRLNRVNAGPRFVNAPPGFHAPVPPANVKIVGRKPGQVVRPGEVVGGLGGRRLGNNANENAGRTFAGKPHVFTNDEVQTTPPEKTRQAKVSADHEGKTFEREDRSNTGIDRNVDRFHGERVLPPREENRLGEMPATSRRADPAISRHERQPGLSQNASSNGSSGAAREHTSAPPQMHSAPAQVPRQSSPAPAPASRPSAPSFSPPSGGGGSHSSPSSPSSGGGTPRNR